MLFVGTDCKSALSGFCTISFKKNKLKIKCFGESSTLKIKSNPEEDEKLIRESFFTIIPKLIIKIE